VGQQGLQPGDGAEVGRDDERKGQLALTHLLARLSFAVEFLVAQLFLYQIR
jgi:hypothetical protein